jgi:hypothetical protein
LDEIIRAASHPNGFPFDAKLLCCFARFVLLFGMSLTPLSPWSVKFTSMMYFGRISLPKSWIDTDLKKTDAPRGGDADRQEGLGAGGAIRPQVESRVLLALFHEAVLGCSAKRLAVASSRLRLARILLAFLDERSGRTGERFAILAHSLSFASGLRQGGVTKNADMRIANTACMMPLPSYGWFPTESGPAELVYALTRPTILFDGILASEQRYWVQQIKHTKLLAGSIGQGMPSSSRGRAPTA